MNQFKREHVQVDIPTLEVVPQDDAERASWEARRRMAEARRRISREQDEMRMEKLREFERNEARPLRRFLRWLGL